MRPVPGSHQEFAMASHAMKGHERVRRAMHAMYEGTLSGAVVEETLGGRGARAAGKPKAAKRRAKRAAASRLSRAR
jgi:hypothetical protein